MKTIILTTIATVIIIIAINTGYDKTMVKYCTNLQNQAIENSDNENYYITKADHDECKEVYNIEINAIVK